MEYLTVLPISPGVVVFLGPLIFVIVFLSKAVCIVPQQSAWVIERLGRYDRTLEPGLQIVVPLYERIAYRHNLKEVPLDRRARSASRATTRSLRSMACCISRLPIRAAPHMAPATTSLPSRSWRRRPCVP